MVRDDLISFTLQGLNFNKFLQELTKNNINVFNLQRRENNNFSLQIKEKDKLAFLKILKKCNIKVLSNKPKTLFLKTITFLKNKLSYVICAIILLLGIIVSNFFVLGVEVYGINKLEREIVIKLLNQNSYKVGMLKSNCNLKALEILIKNNFKEVSLVSCTIYGNKLVVNVYENKYDYNKTFEPITAPFNLIVKNINLKSGTCVVKNGETVKKGEVLISPNIKQGDNFLNVYPNADVFAYAEETISTIYRENHIEKIRSGKKQIFTNITIFKSKKHKCSFTNFEVESNSYCLFKNFIIPIKKEIITCYELEDKMVYIPFNKDIEEKIIEENKNMLYNIFSSCKKVENKGFSSVIEKVENYYLISTTISADVVI